MKIFFKIVHSCYFVQNAKTFSNIGRFKCKTKYLSTKQKTYKKIISFERIYFFVILILLTIANSVDSHRYCLFVEFFSFCSFNSCHCHISIYIQSVSVV